MFNLETEKEIVELLPVMQDFISRVKVTSSFTRKEENEVIEIALATFFWKNFKAKV